MQGRTPPCGVKRASVTGGRARSPWTKTRRLPGRRRGACFRREAGAGRLDGTGYMVVGVSRAAPLPFARVRSSRARGLAAPRHAGEFAFDVLERGASGHEAVDRRVDEVVDPEVDRARIASTRLPQHETLPTRCTSEPTLSVCVPTVPIRKHKLPGLESRWQRRGRGEALS